MQFDGTLKDLMETYPADWLKLVGAPVDGPIELLDTDLATVVADADKLFKINSAAAYLLHLEAQASYKLDLPDRVLLYNTAFGHRHKLLVRNVVLLLRPEADGPAMTGQVQRQFPGEPPYLQFSYEVIRVWELPLKTVMEGGLGTLPLVWTLDEAENQHRAVLSQVLDRLHHEASRDLSDFLLSSSYIIFGLRHDREEANRLFKGLINMRESSTFQGILEQGMEEGLEKGLEKGLERGLDINRQILLREGAQRLGPPSDSIREVVNSITDQEKLGRLIFRAALVSSWEDLFGNDDETPHS